MKIIEETIENDVVDVVENKSTPKQKKTSKWITALKLFNKDKPRYLIPKKGSVEYDTVRKIMDDM